MIKKIDVALLCVSLIVLLSVCCMNRGSSSLLSSGSAHNLYSNAKECQYSNGDKSLVIYYPDGFPRVCSVYSDKNNMGKHLIYDFNGNILSRLGVATGERHHGDNFYEGIIAGGKHEPQVMLVKTGGDVSSVMIDGYYYIDDDLKLVIGLWVRDAGSGELSKLVTKGNVASSGGRVEYSGVDQELTGSIKYIPEASNDGLLHLRFVWCGSSGNEVQIETCLKVAEKSI